MRFFKYLIFVLLFLLSVNVFAKTQYYIDGYPNDLFDDKDSACKNLKNKPAGQIYYPTFRVQDNTCLVINSSNQIHMSLLILTKDVVDQKCPEPGYPINVVQPAKDPIVKVMCVPLAGTDKYCEARKNNYPIINIANTSGDGVDRISYSVSNVSKTPVSNCVPLKEGQCNNKDPYGGCFKVPDDGCTRTQNGSIICPNNDTPNIQNNCTGTYCERPPTGCPSGYVSGSFNGKALCVKSSPSNGSGSGSGNGDGVGNGSGSGNGNGSGSGNGNGSGSGSGSNSSTSSSTSTSTSTSTSSNGSGGSTTVNVTNNNTNTNTNNTTVNVDTSGIIGAINNMKSTLADFLNDINKAVNGVNSTLTGTNQKLDTANTTLNAINQNGKDTNTKLDQLINKGGANGEFDDTGIINAIDKQTTDLKDHYDESLKTTDADFDTSQYEYIGNASDDTRYLSAQSNAQSALQSFANKLTFSNTACVQDFEVQVPIYGSMLVPLSKWCDLLAIVKILLQLGTLMVALKMIDATVRIF